MGLSEERVKDIVFGFRKAIVEANRFCRFDRKDTMSHFPGGCCEFACDLLAFYLCEEYSIITTRYNGLYDDGIFEHKTNHEWLVYNDRTIIDITYSQFEFSTGSSEDIYFGPPNVFYNSLKRVQEVPFYDIRKNEQLSKDYNIIIEYLNM